MNKKVTAIATFIVVMAVAVGAYALNGNNKPSKSNNKEYSSASKQEKDSKINEEIKEVVQEFTGSGNEENKTVDASTSASKEEVMVNGKKVIKSSTGYINGGVEAVTSSSKKSSGGSTVTTVKPIDTSTGSEGVDVITNPSKPYVNKDDNKKPTTGDKKPNNDGNTNKGDNSGGDKDPIDVITTPSKPTTIPEGNKDEGTGGNTGDKEENKPTTKPDVVSTNLINKAKSRIMEVHFVYYGVIVLEDGNINNCKFYVDGKEVTPSKVNKEGTIVKIELGSKASRDLKVVKGSVEDTTTLKYR